MNKRNHTPADSNAIDHFYMELVAGGEYVFFDETDGSRTYLPATSSLVSFKLLKDGEAK